MTRSRQPGTAGRVADGTGRATRPAGPPPGVGTEIAVPRAARSVRRDWHDLAESAASPSAFDPAMVAGLPEPARRWLRHAIAPGTPMWRSAELFMSGQIRLGRWRSFTARQVLAPPDGYIWAATARVAGLPVTGFDRFSSGTGEMSWRLLGRCPVMTASGPDVARSASGRMAGEITLLPTAFPRASWLRGERPGTATADFQFGSVTERAELSVGDDGRLLEVRVDRWGNPGGAPFGRYPFGVSVEAESQFAGITIPSVVRAGWWWGTERQAEGEFFRARITGAVFR
jgi:hypothetical protein